MAAALLAGTSAFAADGGLVKVNPAQLVPGKYVLANAAGDSIVTFTEGIANTWDNVLVKKATPDDATSAEYVDFAKSGSNWSLSYNGRVIYVFDTDSKAYTAVGAQAMVLTPVVADSTATFKTVAVASGGASGATANRYLVRGGDAVVWGLNYNKVNAGNGAKFALYAIPAEAPAGTIEADLAKTEQTFLLVVDGKYVGATIATRATAGDGVQLVDNKPADETGFAWIADGTAYKNLATGKYLTTSAAGILALSETPVAVSYNGNALIAGGYVAGSAVAVQSSTPLPAKLGANWSNKVIEFDADGEPVKPSVILYANSMQAVSYIYESADDKVADYELDQYAANNGTKFVWTLTKVETAKGQYEIRLKDGRGYYLTLNNAYVTVGNATPGVDTWGLPADGIITLKAGSQWVAVNGLALQAVAQQGAATQFGLGQLQNAYMQANSLIYRYGDYFTLDISYKKDGKDVDVTGKFEGNLRPIRSVTYSNGSTDYVDAQVETEFMLVNAAGNIIAVNTDDPLHTGSQKYGFALTTITPKEYSTAVNTGKNPYLTTFRLAYTPGQTQNDVAALTGIEVSGTVAGQPYDYSVGLQIDNKDDVLVVAKPSELNRNVTIKLNAGTLVDAAKWLTKPAYYTVEVINKSKSNAINFEKVLGLDEDGDVAFVDAENIDLTKPEGQFAINQNYKFTNRENQAVHTNIFYGDLYQIDATTFAHVTSRGTDTLSIKPVTDYTSADGFKRFSAAELNANTYNVAMKLLNGTYLNVIENHNDKHRIGLDEENATEWRIEMPTVKLMDATNDLIRLVPDTVTVTTPITYYVSGKGWKTTTATDVKSDYYKPATALKICTYILKNTDNSEYLYGKDGSESVGNAYYVCNDTKTNATRIAFKQVGEETVNLVPAYRYWDYNRSDWSTDQSREESIYYPTYANQLGLSNYKIIGGTTSLTGVLKDVELYEAVSNDLFVIKEATAPTYKKLEQGNKIIISRINNTDDVVFENGEFAGISNRAAYKNIKPTLYVDTAYVNREGNFAYQYLLGVNIDRVDNTEDCGNPNHEHPRTVFTEGRFLINMADSAIANKDVHNNKFEYNGEYKLAFVKGYHQNDTLYFTDDADEVVSKMAVGDANYNLAKYSFKMIDETNNEFVIETGFGYDAKYNWVLDNNKWYWRQVSSTNSVTPGYLRWVNGNLVVTADMDKAERFTMEASDQDAVANEGINASEVSVIAGNGAVAIKGAAGKKVTISNVLGQTIANTVLSSDNATISAPAGVVVVAIEGEAAVKAIVK